MATIGKKLPMDKQKFVEGGIPMQYVYTVGPTLEPFFLKLKNEGAFYGAKCDCCGRVYVPPSLFCECCFKELSKTVKMKPEGMLMSFTAAHMDHRGKELKKPQIFGLILLEGADTPFIHRMVESGEMHIGCRVKAVFKPKAKRTGSWDDIVGFAPA